MIIARIYFGRNIASENREVTDSEFDRFLSNEVCPLFQGFTVSDAIGYWQGERERSNVLEILCEDSPLIRADFQTIRAAYCARFNQDDVLVLVVPLSLLVV